MSILEVTSKLESILSSVGSLPVHVDTTDANAAAADILTGKSGYVNGQKVNGSMPNNGAIDLSINGLDTTSVDIPEGYTSGGTVHMTDDVPNAAETLKTWLTDNGVTVPSGTLLDGLVALLGNVEVGGGGSVTDVRFGEYIPVEDTKSIDIYSLIGKTPPKSSIYISEKQWVFAIFSCRSDSVLKGRIGCLIVNGSNPGRVYQVQLIAVYCEAAGSQFAERGKFLLANMQTFENGVWTNTESTYNARFISGAPYIWYYIEVN